MQRRSPLVILLVAGLVVAWLGGCADRPEPGKRAPAGTLVWNGDVETGDLSQFKDTPWNVAGGASPPAVVSDPAVVRDGKYAVAVTIPGASNGHGICCGSRNEIEPNIEELRQGDDLYFGFSTLLGRGFPTEASWQVITQWKQDAEGSAPLELSVEDGEYLLSGGEGHPDGNKAFQQPISPAVTGRWVDWVFHIKFSPDPDIGYVDIWQDDELILSRFQPASGTMYPSPDGEAVSYLKAGYYRDRNIGKAGTIYFDDWKVGTSRGAVARSSN